MKKIFIIMPVLANLLFSPVTIFGESKWICATNKAEFGKRYGNQTVVFQNKMWVLNGCIDKSAPLKDIWSSTNGKNWTLAVDSAPYPARLGFSAIVFNDHLWIIGGDEGC